MSTTIDQRIVEMQFNNKQFESGVKTSMTSIESLKKGLNFTGATKGLENISTAANRTNFNVLSNAVDTVKNRFSALEVVAVTTLVNITNSAINTGKRMLSALTIDPVKTGLNEYETKINSIQTIMTNTASKGTTMDQVTEVINELNTYADKTIYNFAEMTRNIGTFTAAGIGLEESASAIQGIANLAAASGSTSMQASTAMYQLSQALSTGTVRLMDWNSVVNAGMGGELFQNALKETAREMGIAVDAAIDKNGSFRESLQENWLSADVLNTTLMKFTQEGAQEYANSMQESGKYTEEQAKALMEQSTMMEDAATKVKTFTQLYDTLKESAQSGWGQSWEIIIGNFEEAKELWTGVSNALGGIIGASADARNALLQGWSDLGGRTAMIDAFKNAFEALTNVITPIKEAFSEIFPPTTAKQLLTITENIRDFFSNITLGEDTMDKLRRTAKGFFAIFDVGKQIIVAIWNAIKPLFSQISGLGGGFLNLTARIGDWLVSINNAIRDSKILVITFQSISSVVSFLINGLKILINFLKEKILYPSFEKFHVFLQLLQQGLGNVVGGASNMKTGFVSAIDAMGEAIKNSKLLDFLGKIWTGIKNVFGAIFGFIGDIFGGLFDNVSSGNMSGFFDLLNSLAFGGIAIGLTNLFKNISNTFDNISGILSGISGILDGVRGSLEAWQTNIKSKTLLNIAIAVGILAISLLTIASIDSEKLTTSLQAITVLFIELLAAMTLFTVLTKNQKAVTKANLTMIAMSVSILILASALKKVSSIDPDDMITGVLGIAALAGVMVAAIKLLGTNSKKTIKGSLQIILFATAINILATAVTKIATLSWEELIRGLVGIGVLLAGISAFLYTIKDSKISLRASLNIIAISGAINILAIAVKTLGALEWSQLQKGLITIGLLLAQIAIFIKLTSNTNNMLSVGIGLIAIASAMTILVNALKNASGMSWEEIGKGLIVLSGSLLSLVIALNLLPKNMITIGVGLLAVTTALLILSHVLKNMGALSWEEIGKGLTVLGGAILILSIGLNAMKKTLAGSAALLIATGAILLLVPALSLLGAMSWESIIKGLVAIAGAFTIIGVAGILLKPLTLTLIGLSAAFAIFGTGILLIGAGILALSIGISGLAVSLTALAGAGAATATAIVASLGIIITGLAALIPQVLAEVGRGIIAFAGVISEGAPALAKAVIAIVVSIAAMLKDAVPPFVDSLLYVVDSLLKSLVAYTPSIVNSLFDFLIGLINGVAARLPELIKSVMNVIMVFFKALVDSLKEVDVSVLLQGVVAMGIIANLMKLFASAAKLVPMALVGVVGVGLILAEISLILGAIGLLQQIPGLNWLITEGGKLLQAIGSAIGGFIGGIVGSFLGGMTSQFPKIGSDLSDFMINIEPFVKGAQNINAKMLNGVKAIAETIFILTGANLLNGISKWFSGGASIAELGKEFAEFGPYLNTFYNDIKNIKPDVIEGSANAAKALAEMANNLPKEGGVAGWLAGENSLKDFAAELAEFGPILKQYADDVSGLDSEVVQNSANAAKALSEMANNLPNKGGVVGWFTGENNLSDFAEELKIFGPALSEYADSIAGLDSDIVIASATAAETLSALANNLPNSGGLVSWFTGDNKLSDFGDQLVIFGDGLRKYAEAIGDDFPATAVTVSARAAQALASLANTLPNIGGVVGWFMGEQDLSVFGTQLKDFGKGMREYAEAIGDDFPAATVMVSAYAAKSLVSLADHLPNTGGVFSWFTGDKDLSLFGSQLKEFGSGMKAYADEIGTDFPAGAVSASASAAEALAKLNDHLPTEGGVLEWFTGTPIGLDEFGQQLKDFGSGMKAYADEIGTDFPAGAVSASANAAEALAKLNDYLPSTGGIFEFFTGVKTPINEFGEDLAAFGESMKIYADAIGTNFPDNTVISSANAAKTLAELASILPSSGGIFDVFTGTQTTMGDFAVQIESFGKAMSGYSKALGDNFSSDTVIASANAAKALAEMAATLPSTGSIFDWFKAESLEKGTFVTALANFGNGLSQFYFQTLSIADYERFELLINSFANFMNILNGVTNINYTELAKLDATIEDIGLNSVENFLGMFENSEEKIKAAVEIFVSLFKTAIDLKKSEIDSFGKTIAEQIILGFVSQNMTLVSKLKQVLELAILSLKNYSAEFYEMGGNFSESLGQGIKSKGYLSSQAASYIAQQAINAMNRVFDINSPSGVALAIADNFGGTFVNELTQYGDKAYTSAEKVAVSAKEGLNKAISTIGNNFSDNMDFNPVIKPVLDLSNVNSGIKGLNTSFGQDLAVTAGLNNLVKHQGIQNEQMNSQNGGVTYSFIQNNTSPKALNRLEIYRQTKNLFNASKGMIKK